MHIDQATLDHLTAILIEANDHRRDLLTALAAGNELDVAPYLRTCDDLVLFLANHWLDIRDRVMTTMPNDYQFPKRNP